MEGTIRQGEIEALGLAEAVEHLRTEGLVPIEVTPVRKGIYFRLWSTDKREDILLFTEQLARLIEAGLPIDRALDILIRVFKATGKTFLWEVAENIRRQLARGQSLSEALSATGIFPEFYVSLVHAGEISGALDVILKDLVRYMKQEHSFRQEFQSALLYPTFLLVFGLIAVQTVLVYILPRFGSIFDELGVTPPLITRVLLSIGGFWRAYGWIFLLLLLGGFFVLKWFVRRPRGRVVTENFLLRLPFLGRFLFLADMAQTFRSLAVMIKGGVSIPQAMILVASVPRFRVFGDFLSQTAQRLKEGARLSWLFQSFPGKFDFVVNFLTLGEETGDMAQAFADLAYLCEQEVKVMAKRFLTLIEPATILFFGLLLGGMIISILMAIFDVNMGF